MSVGRMGAMLAALGGVYLVMLAGARLVFIQPSDQGASQTPLWVWFLACVAVGAVLAGYLGAVGVGRAAASAAAFLLGWLVIGPLFTAVFEPLLPERPVIFGVAFAAQLTVLLPRRGALATTWRVVIPIVADVIASIATAPREGTSGPAGVLLLAGALVAVWLLERRALRRRRDPAR